MKNTLFAVVCMLIQTICAAAITGSWEYVTTGSKTAYSFRSDRITEADLPQAKKVWVRMDALKEPILLNPDNPKSKRYSYGIVQWTIYCKSDKYSLGPESYYDTSGALIFGSEGAEFSTKTVIPDTIGDAIVTSFCTYIGQRQRTN